MKTILFVCACFALAFSLLAVDIPYSCEGSVVCDSGCIASCSISGTADGATRCVTIGDGSVGITCEVWQGEVLLSVTDTSCNCGGSGGSGGTGGVCDPTIPLWWIFCDPFPM